MEPLLESDGTGDAPHSPSVLAVSEGIGLRVPAVAPVKRGSDMTALAGEERRTRPRGSR